MDTLRNTAQVAEQLQVAEQTLRYWRHVGSGPPSIKVGRGVRYRQSDVDAWLADNTKGAEAGP